MRDARAARRALAALLAACLGFLAAPLAAQPRSDPPTAELLARARRYLYSGRPAAAETAWREALALSPDHPDTLAELAVALAAAGRFAAAAPSVQQAVAAAKDDWALRLFDATLLLRAGQEAAARARLEALRQSAPKGTAAIAADVLSGRLEKNLETAAARTWQQLGGRREPAELFAGKLFRLPWASRNEALHDGGTLVPAHSAAALMSGGGTVVEGGESVSVFAPRFSLRVVLYRRQSLLVVVRGWKGTPEESQVRLLHEVMEIFEFFLDHSRSVRLLGSGADARKGLGDKLKARRALQQRDARAAETAARAALRVAPDDPQAHALLGWALALQGRNDAALVEEDSALARWPDYAFAHFLRAGVSLHQRRWDETIAASTRAIELDPTNWRAYANLALAYRAKNDARAADAVQARAFELAPGRLLPTGRRGDAPG